MGGGLESVRQGPYRSIANNHENFAFNSLCSRKPFKAFKQRSNMILCVLTRFWQLCREWTEEFKNRKKQGNCYKDIAGDEG